MIQSTGDILTIVKSFAILWVAIFAGWFIFYLAMMAREGYLVMRGMRERLAKIDALIDSIKEKVEHSASYLLLIGEGIKKLLEFAQGRHSEKKRK